MKNSPLVDYQLHIVIDNIRSAYNVGSIFRTADATGCAMLHICGLAPHPPNPKLDKTALGSIESVPWKYYGKATQAIDNLEKYNIPIYSVEITPKSLDYRKVKYPNTLALVFGHELNGITQPILDKSDAIIQIPMCGKKASLNVATAAGIVMFEAIK